MLEEDLDCLSLFLLRSPLCLDFSSVLSRSIKKASKIVVWDLVVVTDVDFDDFLFGFSGSLGVLVVNARRSGGGLLFSHSSGVLDSDVFREVGVDLMSSGLLNGGGEGLGRFEPRKSFILIIKVGY